MDVPETYNKSQSAPVMHKVNVFFLLCHIGKDLHKPSTSCDCEFANNKIFRSVPDCS